MTSGSGIVTDAEACWDSWCVTSSEKVSILVLQDKADARNRNIYNLQFSASLYRFMSKPAFCICKNKGTVNAQLISVFGFST